MKPIRHITAKASHYDKESKYYDEFNEKNSKDINELIAKTLNKYRVKSVLDLACGTGSQVFYLLEKGFNVAGFDINAKMLRLAKAKAKQKGYPVQFKLGDMRTVKTDNTDAVVTIFNAIGHLTRADFIKTMKNIHKQLNPNGLYLFDIFNLNYLLAGDNITKLTIDWQERTSNSVMREIQYSTINTEGVLVSYDLYLETNKSGIVSTATAQQTLQVYTAAELKKMLTQCGFKVVRQCAVDGSRFSDAKTERIMTIAQKSRNE